MKEYIYIFQLPVMFYFQHLEVKRKKRDTCKSVIELKIYVYLGTSDFQGAIMI